MRVVVCVSVAGLLFGALSIDAMHRVKKIVGQMQENPSEVVKADREGTRDIFDAVLKGSLKAIQYWLDQGVDINQKNDRWQDETPLTLAASFGKSLDVVRYLIERGANIESKDAHGERALMLAAFSGKLDFVEYLIERGADKEAKDKGAKTALMHAVESKKFYVVKYLIEQGAIVYDSVMAELLLNLILEYQDLELFHLFQVKDLNKANIQDKYLLIRSVLNNKPKFVEFFIKRGINPYQEDEAGLNTFDYAQGNQEMLAILNKTTHRAQAKKEPVVQRESNTQKAVRRLQHIQRTMHPELPKTSEKEIKTVAAKIPVLSELTQTEAHWKLFEKEVENQYGKVLDDSLVKKALEREKKAIVQGKYVFYRAEPGKYRLYQYFIEELYRLVNLYSGKNEFVWNRFFRDAAKEQTINEYIDTMQAQAHKMGSEFNMLLSANISLFGNVNNSGSCTWDYFLGNYEATGRVELLQMFKRISDQYGFDAQYIDQLLALNQGILEQYATLQQIIIPKNIVDDVVMFATDGYCFPWQDQVDAGQADSCWDPNAISVDLKGNPKKGRYTCISSIIDKYRDGRIAIDDAYQVRILMNAVYGLNPESGIEIYQYTRLPEKKLQHFKTQVQKITDEMFGKWLKEQLSKKEVPESIKDEKLGGVLQHLGKGRKEPVKSKL